MAGVYPPISRKRAMRKLGWSHFFLVFLVAFSLGGQVWSSCVHCTGSQPDAYACHTPTAPQSPAIDAGCCCADGCPNLAPPAAPAVAGETPALSNGLAACWVFYPSPSPRLQATPLAATEHNAPPPLTQPLYRLYRSLLI